MIFSADFLYKLKDLISISSVVSRKVKLQKHGKDYFGVCPFHKEKTGSFSVNDDKKFYHCFGCGAHGDIFKFVQDTENIDFNSAVESLSKAYNIVIPIKSKSVHRDSSSFELNRLSLEFFQEKLFSSEGEHALSYLISRGISRAIISKFGMGYAPVSGLHKYLLSCGYLDKDLLKAGLVKENSTGKIIDRFRDRVIFPIRNRRNHVIAFGGRAVVVGAKPKYLNSPETDIFKKTEVLYLEDELFKQRHLKEVFIVEGYTDAIALSKADMNNVVATLGTAISDHHIRKLWKVVKEPTICMDGDNAGIKAAERAINIVLPILKPGYSINFVSLKSGYDPDDIVSEFGAEHLRLLLQNKTSLSEMIWKIYLSRANLRTPEQQALFKTEIYSIVDKINDFTVRGMYKKYFSTKLFELFTHKTQHSKDSTVNSPVGVVSHSKLSVLQRLEMTIAALLIENAAILQNNEILENTISIEPTISTLVELYKDILEVFNECSIDDVPDDEFNGNFKKKIRVVIKNQLYEYLCGKQSSFIDKVVVNDYNQAISLFNKTFELYKLELLKEDYIKSLKSFDEDSLHKARLLRDQIKEQERVIKGCMN